MECRKGMKRLTIKDIAKMSGFSPTVVSFVINNKPGVSDKTRKKVRQILEETNFRPSLNSRRLILKKSFNISIIIRKDSSPFNNLFYFEIAQGLLEKSKEYGYNIVFTDIPAFEQEVKLPDIIEQKDTDGVIFFQDTDTAVLNEIENLEVPYVVIDAHPGNDPYTCVRADYEKSAYTATNHLIEKGHNKIAFICSSYIPNFYTQVFLGYKKALNSYNISIPLSWLQMDAIDDEASAYDRMERILNTEEKPTAVFCATDMFAVSAIRCAKDNGYRVPDDISFIGIDDIMLSRYIEPRLTTIRIDKTMMGSLAMELLVKKIDGKKVESITVMSDNIIIRDSVRDITILGNDKL